jgi:hypothetical protein
LQGIAEGARIDFEQQVAHLHVLALLNRAFEQRAGHL